MTGPCTHGMPTPATCIDFMDEGNLPPPPRPEPERAEVRVRCAFDGHTITALEDRLDAIHAAAVEAAQADGIAWFAAVDRLLEVCQQSNNRPKAGGC